MTRILTILAATLLVLVIIGGVLLITERTAQTARAQQMCGDALERRLVAQRVVDYWSEVPRVRERVVDPIEADIARYCG